MKITKNKIYNLTTEETIKLFSSKDMAKWNCNVEFTKTTNSGGNHKGRKTGSKNKLSLIYLNNKIDKGLATVNAKADKLSMTVAKLASEVNDVKMILAQLAIEMRQGFAQINSRIDNLVSKNNLKE